VCIHPGQEVTASGKENLLILIENRPLIETRLFQPDQLPGKFNMPLPKGLCQDGEEEKATAQKSVGIAQPNSSLKAKLHSLNCSKKITRPTPARIITPRSFGKSYCVTVW